MPEKKHIYLGDSSLPTKDAEFEYTPKMLREIKKCSQNILHFAENYFYIINPDKGKMKIKLYKYQKRILRALRDNRWNIVLSSRQSGKTTLFTIFALWVALFNEDKRILLVANKESTAINVFSRIRLAYKMMPNWLKAGVEEWGKTGFKLANESSIAVSTTSSDASRGDTCNVLILDELAFVYNHLVEDFWKSVYPIVSASKTSKILIASTANGTDNKFYELYSKAIKGENRWHPERVDWWEVPGRDETWKQETMASLGDQDAFDQEFGNKFIETGESVVDDDLFKTFNVTTSTPEFVYDDGCYHVWEPPKQDRIYVAGVDVAEGVGLDSSVIQILDITDLADITQVARYSSNKITPYKFTTKLHETLKHWGSPPVLVERNNCGSSVADGLKNQLNYENTISYSPSIKGVRYDRAGVYSHTNTKYKGVTNMRYWVNVLKSITIRDVDTVEELKSFVRYPNGTWAARKGDNTFDDKVMALVWALLILENDIVERYFEVIRRDDHGKPAEIKLLDFGVREFQDPTKLFYNESGDDDYNSHAMPMLFPGDGNYVDTEMADMEMAGWKPLGGDDYVGSYAPGHGSHMLGHSYTPGRTLDPNSDNYNYSPY